jgi:nicotinate-nucleotide adenylyltransferase
LRLGILGGTFDPVHRGHLALAAAAHEELGLDAVVFVPAGEPWRKVDRVVSSGDDRLAMLQRAVQGEPSFEVSTLELERPGPSYTADTLEALRDERPAGEYFFVLGEDALGDLPNWRRPGRILELAKLAVARRADTPPQELEGAEQRLPGLMERVVRLEMPLMAISSSEIRDRVRRGLPVGDMVLAAVEGYIREWGLYRF